MCPVSIGYQRRKKMNVRKKGEDSGRSGFGRSKLFGAFRHVHNSFSMSHKNHDTADYIQDEYTGSLRATNLQFEIAKAEAFCTAYNLVARFQKS
jgi:hypothetical protein